MDAVEWWREEVFNGIGDAGYFGLTVPEQYGGQGLDLFTSGIVAQVFGRWNYALALSWVAHENLCLNNRVRREVRRSNNSGCNLVGSDSSVKNLCFGDRISC